MQMDYLGNVTITQVQDKEYLFKNESFGLIAYFSLELKSLKEAYFFTRMDPRSGGIFRCAFINKDAYIQFIRLKDKTKGINSKTLNLFSNLSYKEKIALLEGGSKIKGFSPLTIKKIKDSEALLVELSYPQDIYSNLYTLLSKESSDKDQIESFLSDTLELDKKNESEIKQMFILYLMGDE